MRWLWLLAGLLAASPQTPPLSQADALRLARIKAHMSAIFARAPDYTCQLTIERSVRLAKSRRFRLVDLLRLEVALVGGRELFSWPGAGKFEDRDIGQFAGGTIGNGDFALHARSVLLGEGVAFAFEGSPESAGRPLWRYSYRVPRAHSRYLLKSGDSEGVAGYHGFFDVAQDSLDLVRLDVDADDLPPHLPIRAAHDLLEYARVPIAQEDFLLPLRSELSLTAADGVEHRNRTSFAACRHYSGESVISFADAPTAASSGAPAPAVAVELPAGLALSIALDDTLHFDRAAIGDPVTAHVLANARWKGKTMVPRGAMLHGRLIGVQRLRARTEVIRADLRFTSLEFPGAQAAIAGAVEDVTVLPAWTRAAVDNQGVIYITGSRLELPRGARLTLRLHPYTGSSAALATGPGPRKD